MKQKKQRRHIRIHTFIKEESGQALSEYWPMVLFIAVGGIVVLRMFGEELHAWFQTIVDTFKGG